MKRALFVTVVIALAWIKPLQAQEITVDVSGASLTDVFSQLNQQYGYHFVYVASVLDGLPNVSVTVRNSNIHAVMDEVLQGLPLAYTVRGRVITLTRKDGPIDDDSSSLPITGMIYDRETMAPIPYVSVQWEDQQGTVSSSEGDFEVRVPIGTDSLHFTAVGYYPETVSFGDVNDYRIGLRPQTVGIEEVVVTGIVERRQESYTSATTVISGRQLRQLTNANALAALQALDPAFVIIANNLRGSDPSLLPQIELRGKTSLTGLSIEGELGIDPNLPLFILDGFESSLEQIINLDINRISSVTLLKDAVSSALYGARSANGVVVVETRRPTGGPLRFSYRADIGFETADISDYNMMNALEKVEFERLSGRYEVVKRDDNYNYGNPVALSRAYNERYKKALQGQDFNWLEVPLRPGFTHNHSLFVEGGSSRWQFSVGGNRRNRQGVMRGTDRTTWGVWGDVAFRKGKWSVLAKTFINGNSDDGSPVNDFSRYVRQSPLYTPLDTAKYLDAIPYRDQRNFYQEPNYLYDAQLNSSLNSQAQSYQQNIAIRWQLSPAWELSSQWQLSYQQAKRTEFISPKDTRYDLVPIQQRGSYDFQRSRQLGYQGNIMTTWKRTVADKHRFTVNVRAEVQQLDRNNRGYLLSGFPLENSGRPEEAFDGKPSQLEVLPSPPMIRRLDGLVSANYVFANRYFMDLTARVDGSTQFGSANRYAGFWSAGVGWNMHEESFLKQADFIRQLRVTLNTGRTGNQSFGSFLSTVVYEPLTTQMDDGIAHTSLGNPNLKWQTTYQTNIGLDVELWDGRFVLNGNWYWKNTDPLIGVIDMLPSSGVSNFAMNVGKLKTHGIDASVRFSPIFRPDREVQWSVGVTLFHHQSRYAELADELLALNEQMSDNLSLQRYINGFSPDDLWAVRSLGIEPSTGRELFLSKDGQKTFEYNPADVVVIGNARPWLDGFVNTMVAYKGFSLGAYFRYSLRKELLNDALYEKVENIDFDDLSANQDRRALYDRWQEPGDQARFRGIALLETVPMSSRFIQRENLFSGDALSIGYTFDANRNRFVERLRLKQLRLTGYANDFLRLSNVLAERGTQYPFAKTYSFSLEVTW